MKRFLAHLNVILAGVVLTLVLIDRVNGAMQFIDNRITKGVLFAFCIVALLSGVATLIETSKTKAGRRRSR